MLLLITIGPKRYAITSSYFSNFKVTPPDEGTSRIIGNTTFTVTYKADTNVCNGSFHGLIPHMMKTQCRDIVVNQIDTR